MDWCCQKCNAPVASSDHLTDVHHPTFQGRTGEGRYTVVNPLGATLHLITVTQAEVNEGVGSITWFKGYKGRVMRCKCLRVIGWRLTAEEGKPGTPNKWEVLRRPVVFRTDVPEKAVPPLKMPLIATPRWFTQQNEESLWSARSRTAAVSETLGEWKQNLVLAKTDVQRNRTAAPESTVSSATAATPSCALGANAAPQVTPVVARVPTQSSVAAQDPALESPAVSGTTTGSRAAPVGTTSALKVDQSSSECSTLVNSAASPAKSEVRATPLARHGSQTNDAQNDVVVCPASESRKGSKLIAVRPSSRVACVPAATPPVVSAAIPSTSSTSKPPKTADSIPKLPPSFASDPETPTSPGIEEIDIRNGTCVAPGGWKQAPMKSPGSAVNEKPRTPLQWAKRFSGSRKHPVAAQGPLVEKPAQAGVRSKKLSSARVVQWLASKVTPSQKNIEMDAITPYVADQSPKQPERTGHLSWRLRSSGVSTKIEKCHLI